MNPTTDIMSATVAQAAGQVAALALSVRTAPPRDYEPARARLLDAARALSARFDLAQFAAPADAPALGRLAVLAFRLAAEARPLDVTAHAKMEPPEIPADAQARHASALFNYVPLGARGEVGRILAAEWRAGHAHALANQAPADAVRGRVVAFGHGTRVTVECDDLPAWGGIRFGARVRLVADAHAVEAAPEKPMLTGWTSGDFEESMWGRRTLDGAVAIKIYRTKGGAYEWRVYAAGGGILTAGETRNYDDSKRAADEAARRWYRLPEDAPAVEPAPKCPACGGTDHARDDLPGWAPKCPAPASTVRADLFGMDDERAEGWRFVAFKIANDDARRLHGGGVFNIAPADELYPLRAYLASEECMLALPESEREPLRAEMDAIWHGLDAADRAYLDSRKAPAVAPAPPPEAPRPLTEAEVEECARAGWDDGANPMFPVWIADVQAYLGGLSSALDDWSERRREKVDAKAAEIRGRTAPEKSPADGIAAIRAVLSIAETHGGARRESVEAAFAALESLRAEVQINADAVRAAKAAREQLRNVEAERDAAKAAHKSAVEFGEKLTTEIRDALDGKPVTSVYGQEVARLRADLDLAVKDGAEAAKRAEAAEAKVRRVEAVIVDFYVIDVGRIKEALDGKGGE